jgi:hypothetical protein
MENKLVVFKDKNMRQRSHELDSYRGTICTPLELGKMPQGVTVDEML